MKTLTIKHIQSLENINLELASEVLENKGTAGAIDILNWSAQYAYRPITTFFIAYTSDDFFIKYCVQGSMLKAVYSQDQSPVYEDSCVSFFSKLPNADFYTNFEFNCIGTCYATRRKENAQDIQPLSLDDLAKIKRHSSLGKRVFKEMEGFFQWDLTVKIPFSLMGVNKGNTPLKILANFYKCANDTNSQHFVSWSPVETEKPDFHRPDFFGELLFQ